MSQPLKLACPTCSTKFLVNHSSKVLPFCSERCRLADLNKWFSEERGLPYVPDPEEDEEFPDGLIDLESEI